MLQQTQVVTVIPYYVRFLSEFPTVSDLAAAPEDRVLYHWAGLGYYRRARQLHAAAQVVQEQFEGEFPKSFEEVLSLPGIGRYTAGAICSFAYDQPTPIVEANTQRIYARLLHLHAPLTLSESQSALWGFAQAILPNGKGSGDINQAVMEIGSQVCLPKDPDCPNCPLRSLCPTHQSNSQNRIPAPKPPNVYEEREEVALLVHDASRGYLMRRCEPGERWAGLWDFPRYDVTGADISSGALAGSKNSKATLLTITNPAVSAAIQQFHDQIGQPIAVGKQATLLKHGVTKYRITLRCFHAQMEGAKQAIPSNYRWVSKAGLQELALNSSAKAIVKKLHGDE